MGPNNSSLLQPQDATSGSITVHAALGNHDVDGVVEMNAAWLAAPFPLPHTRWLGFFWPVIENSLLWAEIELRQQRMTVLATRPVSCALLPWPYPQASSVWQPFFE